MAIQRLKRLSRPSYKRGRQKGLPQPIRGDYIKNLEDPAVQEVFARLGRNPKDYKLAKRVVKLQQKYPNGTLPELVTIDWLEQQKIDYYYLVQIYGGHARRGGIEIDLLIQYGGRGLALMVMGEFFHTKVDVALSDMTDAIRLLGASYHGITVEQVVALWELDIINRRPEVFDMALLGIGLREQFGIRL